MIHLVSHSRIFAMHYCVARSSTGNVKFICTILLGKTGSAMQRFRPWTEAILVQVKNRKKQGATQ